MRTKRSSLAGTWYPGRADDLQRLVDGFLAEGDAEPTRVEGLIVPHAGYRYSGVVAGKAFRLLWRQPVRRAVILAPSHRAWFRGAAVLEVDAFETPLGHVPVDPSVADLVRQPLVQSNPAPFEREHALEIQLPFLQRTLPEVRVVPLLFGELTDADYTVLAAMVGSLADDDTVFIVSSDFTHYGSRFDYLPFPANDAEQVRQDLRVLDMGAIEPVLRRDPLGFQQYLDTTGATVCGRTPIRTFITWSGLDSPGRLLAYQTSLDVTGDYQHCVSYAAIAFP